jgi:D-alanine transaminase
MLVYLNGDIIPRDEARISVDDRGFVFGDGVYEVTRVINGHLFEEEAHWQRLQASMESVSIRSDFIDQARIRSISEELLRENGLLEGEATVYVQVTRGVAPRAHAFPGPEVEPTLYAFTNPFRIPLEQRAKGVGAITAPDIRWTRCDIKSINLLPNAMAKQRAIEAGAWEALFIRDGALTEGALTNVFGVLDGELRTYPKSNYILAGITREVVLELARELGIPTRETPVYAEQLAALDELFLTGTTTDVQAVVSLDGRPVGTGRVGPISKALNEALVARMGRVVAGAT